MKPRHAVVVSVLVFLAGMTGRVGTQAPMLSLNSEGYFEGRGVNVLVFSNWYSGEFSDSKLSGVELIHHGVRTATNGDIRLSSTPAQWGPIPRLSDRRIDQATRRVLADLAYPDDDFRYRIEAEALGGGVFGFAMRNDILHRAFPGIIGPEYTLRGLDYILGMHPASDVSLVSGVGAAALFIYVGNAADTLLK